MAAPTLSLLVPRSAAESVRRELRRSGYVDPTRRVVARANGVLLPLRERPPDPLAGTVVAVELPRTRRGRQPRAAIPNAARLPGHLRRRIPRKWERVGDVILLGPLHPDLRAYREEIGRAFGTVLVATAVLVDAGGVSGPFREPHLERIWGGTTETTHRENGVRFRFDAAAIMFSSGNLRERIRMATMPGTGETVVDLFAGIGYFSIPMSVHSAARRIVACEVNPTAFRYLCDNIRLNRAGTVEPRFGDCRQVAPRHEADRVVMGYLDAAEYLPLAVDALRPRGGWLHYHEACPDDTPDRPAERVVAASREAGYRVASVRSFRLKSYAPRVGHWVVDAHLER